MLNLINEPDLMEWSGHKRRPALVEWLRKNGIPYLIGREGRICCTTDAVSLPLMRIQHNNDGPDEIEF